MSTRGRDADMFLPPPADSPSQSHPSNTTVDLLNPLMRLKDALEGAQKNTRRMITKLEKFEKRLDDLDQHMQPIQESTKQYTLAKDNITAILTEVNKTYEYFRVANDVKDVIGQGITVANQKDYFEALVKLSKAKQFFESHREMKSSASVLSNIDSLFEKAVEACTKEFEKLLGEIGPAAVSLTEGGGAAAGSPGNTALYQVCNPITQEASKQLKSIIETFESSKNLAYFKTYQQHRITLLKNALKGLEQSQQTDWISVYTDEPYLYDTHPFKVYIQYSYALLRGEYTIWGETLPSTEESLSCYTKICEAIVADLVRILHPYVGEEGGKGAAGSTAGAAGKKGGGNVVARQSKLLLMRLDLFAMLNAVYEEFRDICHPDARRESTASIAWKQLRDSLLGAIIKSLEFLLSATISEGFVMSKHDEENICDTHLLTSSVIYTCKELTNYTYTYKRVYEMCMSMGLCMSASVKVPQEGEEVVCALLENLFAALENRAEKLDEPNRNKATRRSITTSVHNLYEHEDKAAEECILTCRKHLFLANNYYAMFTYVKDKRDGGEGGAGGQGGQGSGLKRRASFRSAGPYKNSPIPALADKLESRLLAEQELFCESVAISLALGVQDLASFTSAYNKDKANMRILKSQFMLVNTGVEALLAQQGEWRVSSPSLREALTLQLGQRIMPVYTTFFNTYSAIKFSKKHMSEYVRYPPSEMEKVLRNFFGKSG